MHITINNTKINIIILPGFKEVLYFKNIYKNKNKISGIQNILLT